MQQQMQQRAAMEEQKQAIRQQRAAYMTQLLSEEARVRLGNVAAVKPEKAEKLENIIITQAQRGAFQGKVTEQQLIDLLEQVGAVEAQSEASTVERAKHKFDDEDDLDLDNLDI